MSVDSDRKEQFQRVIRGLETVREHHQRAFEDELSGSDAWKEVVAWHLKKLDQNSAEYRKVRDYRQPKGVELFGGRTLEAHAARTKALAGFCQCQEAIRAWFVDVVDDYVREKDIYIDGFEDPFVQYERLWGNLDNVDQTFTAWEGLYFGTYWRHPPPPDNPGDAVEQPKDSAEKKSLSDGGGLGRYTDWLKHRKWVALELSRWTRAPFYLRARMWLWAARDEPPTVHHGRFLITLPNPVPKEFPLMATFAETGKGPSVVKASSMFLAGGPGEWLAGRLFGRQDGHHSLISPRTVLFGIPNWKPGPGYRCNQDVTRRIPEGMWDVVQRERVWELACDLNAARIEAESVRLPD